MAESKREVRNPDYKPDNTTVRERPVIEEVREWQHPQEGSCGRKDKPVFTKPDAIPAPCGRGNPWASGCGQETWISKGRKLRDAGSKRVVGDA